MLNGDHKVDSQRDQSLASSLAGRNSHPAPGTGGMRPEFLVTQAQVWDDENSNINAWGPVNYFCMQYVSGGLPPWFYQSVMTVETVGLFKTAERHKEKLRPIGIEILSSKQSIKISSSRTKKLRVSHVF